MRIPFIHVKQAVLTRYDPVQSPTSHSTGDTLTGVGDFWNIIDNCCPCQNAHDHDDSCFFLSRFGTFAVWQRPNYDAWNHYWPVAAKCGNRISRCLPSCQLFTLYCCFPQERNRVRAETHAFLLVSLTIPLEHLAFTSSSSSSQCCICAWTPCFSRFFFRLTSVSYPRVNAFLFSLFPQAHLYVVPARERLPFLWLLLHLRPNNHV